jgi:PAS domain S-box-containing protein
VKILQETNTSQAHLLHRNEEIFKLLVDAVTDYAVFALDTNGYILTWNKGAELLKGYSEAEAISQHFSIFYTQDDIARGHPQEELKMALEHGRYEEDGWRIRKDGKKFWANLVITPLRDTLGNHIGFTKITRDLTERRQAEQLKNEEAEKFRLMVDSVKDYAIFMLDPHGIVVSWNEGAKKFKGYEASEIIGKHFSTFYLPEDIRSRKPQMELEIASTVGRFEDEGWRLRKDGTTFWANVVITALHDKHGTLFGFSKVTRDLTERKKAEEHLKLAYEGLERRIKEKTSLLESALKTRDEFLSIASHELKTPITSIKMQIQMVQLRIHRSKTDVVDIPKLNKALDVTMGQITRLTQLIDDLLDISRIQAGKMTYTFETFNFSQMLDEILEGFSHLGPQDKNPIKVFVDPELEGCWDRMRIEQILVNLISNAFKYAPGSSIVIYAKEDGPNAIFSVQDFGPGIPKENRGKIFERFERLGQSSNVAGLGLGLYISKQIALAHQGKIELKSGEEIGSHFLITLPLKPKF